MATAKIPGLEKAQHQQPRTASFSDDVSCHAMSFSLAPPPHPPYPFLASCRPPISLSTCKRPSISCSRLVKRHFNNLQRPTALASTGKQNGKEGLYAGGCVSYVRTACSSIRWTTRVSSSAPVAPGASMPMPSARYAIQSRRISTACSSCHPGGFSIFWNWTGPYGDIVAKE